MLKGVFEDELKEMAGEIERITTNVKVLIFADIFKEVFDVEYLQLHRGNNILFELHVLAIQSKTLHDDSQTIKILNYFFDHFKSI